MALGQRLFGKVGGFKGLTPTTVGGSFGPRLQRGTDEERAERFSNFLGAASATGAALSKIGAGISKSKILKQAAFDEETTALASLSAGKFELASGIEQFEAVREGLLASTGVRGILSSGSIATAIEETRETQQVFEGATTSAARISNLARRQRALRLRRQAKNMKFNSVFGGLVSIASSFTGSKGGAPSA